MNCPMCGTPIGDGDVPVCASCPLSGPHGCRSELTRCPTCGYHAVATRNAEPALDGQPAGDGMPGPGSPALGPGGPDVVRRLSEVRRGESGRIVGFGELDTPDLRDLMAHGVVPAAPVRLLQCRPAYVLELSGGDVAVGDELAESILVAVAS